MNIYVVKDNMYLCMQLDIGENLRHREALLDRLLEIMGCYDQSC
jgi:hypothetical protein